MKPEDLSALTTEGINPLTRDLDQMSTLELVKTINQEDARVAQAVAGAAAEIAAAIDAIAARMRRGGRLIYIGAGTSGRLGVLDASECPPTFNVPAGLVVGIIAGGDTALRNSVEAAEDRPQAGEADLKTLNLRSEDSVVGLSASGRTPYVIGALDYARTIRALAVGLACNRPSALSASADIAILVPVGSEVLSGSTRLKSGTAQKMVLNLISTGVMVRLGKTYGNLMIDLRPTNDKLRLRAAHLVSEVSGVSAEAARGLLESSGWEVKTAVVMAKLGCTADAARAKLADAGGFVRRVI